MIENLRKNVEMNFPGSVANDQCVDVSVCRLDWSEYASTEDNTMGKFDLVIGADIIYETDHAKWIRSCLDKLLECSKPRQSFFHLLIPLRKTHSAESKTIDDVFGRIGNTAVDRSASSLTTLESMTISKAAFSGDRAAEDVHYAYYKIGFVEKAKSKVDC